VLALPARPLTTSSEAPAAEPATGKASNVSDVKKHLGTLLTSVAMIAGLALLGFLAWSWWQSRLPGSYDVMSYGTVDDGGAQPIAHHHFGVDSLNGPAGNSRAFPQGRRACASTISTAGGVLPRRPSTMRATMPFKSAGA